MPHFHYDGLKLFYREQGHGPLLLILPGNTASSAHHVDDLAYFSQRFHAVSLDFAGTGQSDRLAVWPLDWWVQGAHAAAALIDHLGEERAIVLGTSGGGIVALHLAIQHPDRVRAVIADSCIEHWPPDALRASMAIRALQSPEQVAFWRSGHGDDWAHVIGADTAMLLRFADTGGDVFAGRLSEIQCPVLITASRRDEALVEVEAQVKHMAGQIRGAKFYLADDGAHPFMWSRSEEFRRVADEFTIDLLTEKPPNSGGQAS
ncbi:MAG: alpha/beta fold hydrolase [Chloroflexi bacterium]|nr:alpha/beta fold hydrolase [Chloroflexota bacterium]